MIVGNPTKGDELIELMSHYLSDPIIKVKVISYSPPPRIIIISAFHGDESMSVIFQLRL